jgi:hypothetical protein
MTPKTSPHPEGIPGASRTRAVAVVLLALGWVLFVPGLSTAQEYSLFDRFSVSLGGSALGLTTEIRLDSSELERGTTINFEDDLGLSANEIVPALGIQARFGRRHLVTAAWSKADRGATSQSLSEIEFGDITIPGGSAVTLSFDQEQISAAYTYYFLLRDRWTLGVRGGLRVLSLQTFLGIRNTDISDEGDTSAPLPFIGFSYRYGIMPRLRLISDFGWLSLKVGDVDGSQILADAGVEYLVWKNASFGFALTYATLDVNITNGDDFTGSADLGSFSGTLFVKGRW